MDNRIFAAERVTNRVTRIIGPTREMMYLIQGDVEAALVDTGCGVGSIAKYVAGLTSLPVTVLLTHGHLDHALGIQGFQKVYMRLLDREVLEKHQKMQYRMEYLLSAGKKVQECDLVNIDADMIQEYPQEMSFDLGGLHIRILPSEGHTPGSVSILLVEERILITGDAITTSTWLLDDTSGSIEEYHSMLQRMIMETRGQFDRVLVSHDPGEAPPRLLMELEKICREILAGRDEAVPGKKPLSVVDHAPLFAKAVDSHGNRLDGGLGNILYYKK